jgi:hypothetical protein
MVPINITGVTDPDNSDTVSIKVDKITQDEPTKRNNGDRAPDGEGIGTSTAKVRSERAGNGDGRVYEITFTATDSSGATCSGSVTVGVPKGNQLIDSGQKYDSTKVNQFIDNNMQNLMSDSTPDNNEILFVKSTDSGNNFSDPENISNNAGSSENPSIVVSGNNVYVAWSNSASASEILFIKSTDSGDNFTNPENISNNAGTSENPVIAVSGNNVYVAWIDNTSGNNDVPIAVSENGGENFSTPIIISNNADAISNPQITIFGNNISITWIDNSSGTNKIVIAESTDGGDSFSAPRTVSNNPNVYVTWEEDDGITGLQNVFIAVSNNNGIEFNTTRLSNADQNNTFAEKISNPVIFGSNVYSTWVEGDNRIGKSDAFIAVSNDNGTSFTRKNLSIMDSNGTTSVYPLIKPVVSDSNVYVAWIEGDNRIEESDAFIAVSNNNGATFKNTSLSIPISNGTTDIDRPDSPIIPITSGDNVYVTWVEDENGSTDKKDAFIAVSNNNGATFNTTRLSNADQNNTSAEKISNPVVFGSNVYTTWIEEENKTSSAKDAFIAVSNNNGATFNTTRLSDPILNGIVGASSISKPVVSGNNVFVTWPENENVTDSRSYKFFIAASNDTGQTFNTTRLSITGSNSHTHINLGNNNLHPVVSGNNVYVTWIEDEARDSMIGDAFIAVSNNTGQTFNTARLNITDSNNLAREEGITNPVASRSNVYATWIGEENNSSFARDAFIAVSNNTGQTFNTTSLSIPNPNDPTRIDRNSPISSSIISGNNVYVTWGEESIDGNKDPFIAISNDTGQTFNTMNLSTSIFNPREGGGLQVKSPVVSGNSVYVTWIEVEPGISGEENDVLIAVSKDTGQTFNTTRLSIRDPDGGTTATNLVNELVVSGNNVYVTWREDINDDTNRKNAFIAVSNDNGASFRPTEGLSIYDRNSLSNVHSIGEPVVP